MLLIIVLLRSFIIVLLRLFIIVLLHLFVIVLCILLMKLFNSNNIYYGNTKRAIS